MTSDVEDHTQRPVMLHSDRTPPKPAAAAAGTLEKKAGVIGAACSRMPMPAVTLQNRTVHSIQNCGVLIAFVAVTLPALMSEDFDSSGAAHPPGCQPSAGTRRGNAPAIIATK